MKQLTRHPWQVHAVMSSFDVTTVNRAFSDLRAVFSGTPLATLAWVINGYGVVFVAALISAGAAGRRIGRGRVFLAKPSRIASILPSSTAAVT